MIMINGKYRVLIEQLFESTEIMNYPGYDEGLLEKILWSIDNAYLEDSEANKFQEILKWAFDNGLISYPYFTHFEVDGLNDLNDSLTEYCS